MSTNSIKEQIENELSVLIGERIRELRRVALMGGFNFGDDIEAERTDDAGIKEIYMTSKFILHVHSSWRLLKDGEIYVGQSDLFNRDIGDFKIPEDSEESANKSFFTQASNELNEVFERETIRVTKIEANNLGDLKIYMENDYCLEVFVDAFEDNESWRFFRSDASKHFIIFCED